MSQDIKNVIYVAAGFIFGLWLYYLYGEGGWNLMLTDGWKGLLVILLLLGLVLGVDRAIKTSTAWHKSLTS